VRLLALSSLPSLVDTTLLAPSLRTANRHRSSLVHSSAASTISATRLCRARARQRRESRHQCQQRQRPQVRARPRRRRLHRTPTRDDDDSTGSSCNSSNRLLSFRSPQVLIGTANLAHNSSGDSCIAYDPGGDTNDSDGRGLACDDDDDADCIHIRSDTGNAARFDSGISSSSSSSSSNSSNSSNSSSVFSDATHNNEDDINGDSSPVSTHTPFLSDHNADNSIEDTTARDDGDNAGSSDDDNIAYDPSGINSNTFGGSTQDTGDDIIRKFPFDTDVADSHDADHRGRDTELGNTIIKSDDSRIVYDPGGIGFSNASTLGGINDSDGRASHTTATTRATTATSFTVPVATTSTTTAAASASITIPAPATRPGGDLLVNSKDRDGNATVATGTTTPMFIATNSGKPRTSSSRPPSYLQPTTIHSSPTRDTPPQRHSKSFKMPSPPQQPQNSPK